MLCIYIYVYVHVFVYATYIYILYIYTLYIYIYTYTLYTYIYVYCIQYPTSLLHGPPPEILPVNSPKRAPETVRSSRSPRAIWARWASSARSRTRSASGAQVKFATNVHQKDLTAMSNSEFPTKYHPFLSFLAEGSLEVKLPTIWTDEKQRWEESEKRREEKRREEKRREDQKRESFRRKKIQVREKVEKSRDTVFFEWFVAHEGRKVGWLKQRVRSHLARWEMNNCTLLWREAHFEVKTYKAHHSQTLLQVEMLKKCMPLWHEAHFEIKMCKAHQIQTTFGSCDVEQVHAVVA